MKKDSLIWVVGHRGLVGSAIVRKLQQEGYTNILTSDTRVDYWDGAWRIFGNYSVDYVFLCASKVGGILANDTYPADFIRENLGIISSMIGGAYINKVKKFLYLGSSCIYPRECPQPIKEKYLMTGPLEPTNSAYAVSKIAGIETCKAYHKQYGFNPIILMPTNLYGINDNFNLESAHVLPALIRKFHEAKIRKDTSVTLWGTGTARREFMYVDDLANISIELMNNYDYNTEHPIINVGTGKDITISDLAKTVANIVGYNGKIWWDTKKPDGTPRKLLDVSYLHSLGLSATVELEDGIKKVYDWYCENIQTGNVRV